LLLFSPVSLRPTSPKSDTEYELDKSSQQSAIKKHTILGWQWKWGELPEQKRNVFRYLWPSSAASKETTPKEGIYLDDITNNKCNDRSRYLPQMYDDFIDYLKKIKSSIFIEIFNRKVSMMMIKNQVPEIPFHIHLFETMKIRM
jgi:hypothetical protein